MQTTKQTTTGGPKCPSDHPGTPLQRTGDTRMWKCPISQALFQVDTEDQAQTQTTDKYGSKQTVYTIKGNG